MVKRKVSLNGDAPEPGSPGAFGGGARAPAQQQGATPAQQQGPQTLELFFNSGIVFHDVGVVELPRINSRFGREGRRIKDTERSTTEVCAVDHLGELCGKWFGIPYQLSCLSCVQVMLAKTSDSPRSVRVLLAIDTIERDRAGGRHLDASIDAERPYRPLDPFELAAYFEQPYIGEFVRRLEANGVEHALSKLAALIETVGPSLPKIRFSMFEGHTPIPVSLILDLGNSRSTALLVEPRDKGMSAVSLELRSSSNPFAVTDETFDSRITFMPSSFDKGFYAVGVGASFATPSIARVGREALDRALETPHSYMCTLSGPKRYLWDDRQTPDPWFYAAKLGDEYTTIYGRVLKHVVEENAGLTLREDGPSAPPEPRYPPRTMMLFAFIEILSQAISQINSISYRSFHDKPLTPRVLQHLVVTYPSAMRDEEKRIYERIIQNAVTLTCHVLNLPAERRPNWTEGNKYAPFLYVDEALASQMVYLYQEVAQTFVGDMEEFVRAYGAMRDGKKTVRIASVDIGGGTSDVMIAEYEDKLPGSGTSLGVKKLFQDGVGVAGDEVCRAIVEEIVLRQVLQQVPSAASRAKLVHLFGDWDSAHGAAWRTLKAKLVPYLWLPLARCYWSLAEGFEIPEHTDEKPYSVSDIFGIFQQAPFSTLVLQEADRVLCAQMPDFPGLANLFFRFRREEVEAVIESVLREPLRRYADLIAQYDVDLLVLAGRTSALRCIREIFVRELPVAPARIQNMSRYAVGDWYPPKWRDCGEIKDAKSTVTAGAAVLHLASHNALSGFVLEEVSDLEQHPIFGIYRDLEPHISYAEELFAKGTISPPIPFTNGMMIGFRNVASQEMDGSPLFEVRCATDDVKRALTEDRVALRFELRPGGDIGIHSAQSQRDLYSFGKDDFYLALRTSVSERYWLDAGVFPGIAKHVADPERGEKGDKAERGSRPNAASPRRPGAGAGAGAFGGAGGGGDDGHADPFAAPTSTRRWRDAP